jgi:hypothetical protein
MRWVLLWLAIALIVLWAIVRFALVVTSAFIHILLGVAVLLLLIAMIRGASRSSAP